MFADLSSVVVAVSAALVGVVALGTIGGVVTRTLNKRQSEHITAVVAAAIDAKLAPIKEAVGEKNGDGDAMEMLAKTLVQQTKLLDGQKAIREFESELVGVHKYAEKQIHRLNGQVGVLWADFAKRRNVNPNELPPPQPSPKTHP